MANHMAEVAKMLGVESERNYWKPKFCECYWMVNQYGNAVGLAWIDGYGDNFNYKLGNCYRTREEAEANRDKWIKFYASDEVLEV